MMSSGKFYPNKKKAFEEHREILEAIERHDPEQAVAIITEHLNNTRLILETAFPDSD
jgi:DNA-binding GntR family transcriptional regulator